MKKLILFAACFGCGSSQNPSSTPPPSWGVPISGGTMLVTKDGTHAVIADPDRDQIVSIDLFTHKVSATLPLGANEEPGRIAEDGAGRIHVALRRGRALLNLTDATTLHIASRVQVCAEPRGVAWEPTTDLVHVACTGGELVSVPAGGTSIGRVVTVDRDLRDVVVANGQLFVTRFRTAELLMLDGAGRIMSRAVPPTVQRVNTGGDLTTGATVDAIPAIAWRSIALPDGRLLIAHQRQLKTMLHVTHGGYGGDCGHGPIEDAVSVVRPGQGITASFPLVTGALPVDMAASAAGDEIAVITAGDHHIHRFSAAALDTQDPGTRMGCGCGGGDLGGGPTMGGGGTNGDGSGSGSGSCGGDDQDDDMLGAPTSVQFTPAGDLLAFYPELPAVVIHSGAKATTIRLPGEIGYDSGRQMFHTQTSVGLACASCHPEARDDGLVWQFETEGTRRTQSLAGNILDRAPYHWSGDETDLPKLMDDVFSVRMAGPAPTNSQHASLGPWLNRVPAPAPATVVDPQAVARGKMLFESAEVGCANCHSGPLYTNHQLVDVGTGAPFKVPSLLGVAARPPFLHDGSAPTLAARFGATGGGDHHGHTSQLTAFQVADLVAFLQSL
jgi:hypothetical protein